jgi:hypothetical protein
VAVGDPSREDSRSPARRRRSDEGERLYPFRADAVPGEYRAPGCDGDGVEHHAGEAGDAFLGPRAAVVAGQHHGPAAGSFHDLADGDKAGLHRGHRSQPTLPRNRRAVPGLALVGGPPCQRLDQIEALVSRLRRPPADGDDGPATHRHTEDFFVPGCPRLLDRRWRARMRVAAGHKRDRFRFDDSS